MMTVHGRIWIGIAGFAAAAAAACGQVTTGSFAPDAIDDYESYPGGRTFIRSLFGGSVPVIPVLSSHLSCEEGEWSDRRSGGGEPIQARSGSRFGAIEGDGDFRLDFRGIGGISGFSGWACAGGPGDDTFRFFNLEGEEMTARFLKAGGFGAGGVMEPFSFVSPLPIGVVELRGPDTAFDDLAYAAAQTCPACLADCDGSGALDLFDFLCFQNHFAGGAVCADCDGSGELNFFDFLCFQGEFAAGCPQPAIERFGTEAPPTVLCGRELTPFAVDSRPEYSAVLTVPSPLGGELVFSSPLLALRIPSSWRTWSHGYSGSVYFVEFGLKESVAFSIPPQGAFYFYAQPDPFADIEFEIIRDGGPSVVTTIHGESGAQGFGFCGGVGTIRVRSEVDFAVGEFGIAD